ncbi:hypothetical protein V8E55_000395 [Tylopilus felleus]
MQTEMHPTDVILRSSDNQLFHSWKTFLSLSSPILGAMFALPQPETSDNVDAKDHDELPIIDLAEDSCTLDHILSLCHPPSLTRKQFKIDSVSELRALIDATVKYDMENVRRAALEELSNPSVLREDPMWTFVIACQYERREAARLAAKHTLALPSLMRAYMPELEKIHAGMLWALFLYRERCATVARELAADHTWIVYTDSSSLFGCDGEEIGTTVVRHPPSRKYRTGRPERMTVHRWWIDYMRKSECALQRWPHGDAIRYGNLVGETLTEIFTSTCEDCKASNVSDAFRIFVNFFAENIERRVAEVDIELGV